MMIEKWEKVFSDSKWQYFKVEKCHKLYDILPMNQISASRAAHTRTPQCVHPGAECVCSGQLKPNCLPRNLLLVMRLMTA